MPQAARARARGRPGYHRERTQECEAKLRQLQILDETTADGARQFNDTPDGMGLLAAAMAVLLAFAIALWTSVPAIVARDVELKGLADPVEVVSISWR